MDNFDKPKFNENHTVQKREGRRLLSFIRSLALLLPLLSISPSAAAAEGSVGGSFYGSTTSFSVGSTEIFFNLEKDSITKIFTKQKMELEHCQLLLDELAGAQEVITIKNPVGWVRTIAANADFTPEHAGKIQAKRLNAQRLKAREIAVVKKTAEQLEDERLKAIEAKKRIKAILQGAK